RLAVNVGRDVVRLLRRQTARIGLWHVVLTKGRHFCNVIHASTGIVHIRPPHCGYRGWLSRTIRTMAYRALLGVDLAAAITVSAEFGKLHESSPRKWMACGLVLGEPLGVCDKPNHDWIAVRNAVSVLATLETLLDAFLECNHRLLTIPVYRKHTGHADQRNSSGNRSAPNMAMAATHLVSDIGRGKFRGVIEYAKAKADAVAQGPVRNRRGVGRRPGLCRVSNVACTL